MSQELYSIEQVAERLKLHVRTVRRYVREGRLKAVRIGKQYRITRSDLEAMTGPAAPDPAIVRERRVEASCIVQIDAVSPEEALRIGNALVGAAKGRGESGEPLQVQSIYDASRGSLRVILIGGLRASARMLEMLDFRERA